MPAYRSQILAVLALTSIAGSASMASAQNAASDPIAGDLYLEIDARIGADDLAALAIEQLSPFFRSVSTAPSARDSADLLGRLELWRYGNVPGAGWTCIADILFEVHAPSGELIYRDYGRGCGATKLRKGLFRAALAELGPRAVNAATLHDFLHSGRIASPSAVRPEQLENAFAISEPLDPEVRWDVVVDSGKPRSALVMISDPRRRSRSLTQIRIDGDALAVTRNPDGLPIGDAVDLLSSVDGEIFARIDAAQYRLEHEAWQAAGGFPPCFDSVGVYARGYCAVVVHGSVVDSPRRWRLEIIAGSGIGAVAILPIPMLYRAPKLVVAKAPFTEASSFAVLDRETAHDFSPDWLSSTPGSPNVPWRLQLDSKGVAHLVAKTARPDQLRLAQIELRSLEQIDPVPSAALASPDADRDASLRELIETRSIVDVDSMLLDVSCKACSFKMAVDPDTGTTFVLSRDLRQTWVATFIARNTDPVTVELPDMIWPLDVLPAGNDRFYVLGYLPLALIGLPGRLGIHSIAADQPITHEVTLTLDAWALLEPPGFEWDRHSGSILIVWREKDVGLKAAWYTPPSQ